MISKLGDKINYWGSFVDNHDKPRFLYEWKYLENLKGALAISLFLPGIPIVYYGDEQGYHGGTDPNCREPLWTHMDPTSSLYLFLQKAITIRKKNKIWETDYNDIWREDNYFVFSRGNVLCIFTNGKKVQQIEVKNIPYADGTKICNGLKDNDCVTINGGVGDFNLEANETKLYVVTTSEVAE